MKDTGFGIQQPQRETTPSSGRQITFCGHKLT
jgi:hypothetical protein